MNSKQAQQIVYSIQSEYREIIKGLVSQDELRHFKALDQTGMRLFVAEKLLGVEKTIKVPGGSISPFEERMNLIAHEVSDFWKINGTVLASALQSIAGFKLASTVSSLTTSDFSSNVRRLCIYFDTLIFVCPIHEGNSRLESRYGPREIKNEDEMKAKLHIAVNLLNLALTEPLLSTSTFAPVVVIVPDFYASLDNCEQIDISAAEKLLKHILGPSFNYKNPDSALALIQHKYSSDKIFELTFDELISSEYANHLPAPLRRDSLKSAPLNEKAALFLYKIGDSSTEFNILSSCAAETHADPIILSHKQRIFKNYLETGAAKVREQFTASKLETIVANGLLAKKMGFLEALSFEDLRIIRSEGALEKTRESLRAERERFRNADYEQTGTMADNFSDRFINIIKDTGESYTKRDLKLKSNIRKNAVYCAGACTIGIASIALPQTLILQAIGLGSRVTVGGSILALSKAISERKTEADQYKQNPLGVMYGAMIKDPKKRTGR